MTYPQKETPNEHPIIDPIKNRWSPRFFTDKIPDEETINILFEAARWAPSSFNEQPWRYVYALINDGDAREKLESLLVEGNAWAKKSPFLMISFYKKTFAHNGKDNRFGLHDVGAANISIALQVTALGLAAQQMGGFAADKANELLGVPSDFYPGSMMAIGYPVTEDEIPNDKKEDELAPRKRNSVESFAFHGKWGSVTR